MRGICPTQNQDKPFSIYIGDNCSVFLIDPRIFIQGQKTWTIYLSIYLSIYLVYRGKTKAFTRLCTFEHES